MPVDDDGAPVMNDESSLARNSAAWRSPRAFHSGRAAVPSPTRRRLGTGRSAAAADRGSARSTMPGHKAFTRMVGASPRPFVAECDHSAFGRGICRFVADADDRRDGSNVDHGPAPTPLDCRNRPRHAEHTLDVDRHREVPVGVVRVDDTSRTGDRRRRCSHRCAGRRSARPPRRSTRHRRRHRPRPPWPTCLAATASAAVRSAASPSRSATSTALRAKSSEIALPMPDPPPVTTATLPTRAAPATPPRQRITSARSSRCPHAARRANVRYSQ